MGSLIQVELTEALADLQAKCPGGRIHVAVHDAPFETFADNTLTGVRVVVSEGRSWLYGCAKGDGYHVDVYSVDLPKASAPELTEVA